jgi:farnesyl-diphosphate farnesyltransferase
MIDTTVLDFAATHDDYLSTWMQKVSRSFALMIPWLEAPLDRYLATAYLLCRVADNVEDCWQPAAWKAARFAEVELLLAQPHLAGEVLSGWQGEDWPGLTPDEQQLMGLAGQDLWQIYAGIPPAARTIVHRWIREMVQGMSQLDRPDKAPYFVDRAGLQVLARPADYNHYCYIVAGTVGYLSTELVVQHYHLPDHVARRLLLNCEACGRSLQKVNIVKDFARDLERGISYLPAQWLEEVAFAPLSLQGAPAAWTQKLVEDLLAELQDATNYLLTLPYEAVGYRMTGLLSLLPTYQTLLLAAQRQDTLFTAEHQVKISRQTMAQCLEDARQMVADNPQVLQYSRRLDRAIRATFNGAKGAASQLD